MNLISILLSLCLSAFIMGGSLKCYAWIKQQWEISQTTRQDQEILKVLFQFLYQDLQRSGYRGLRTLDKSFPVYPHYSEYTEAYRYFREDRSVFSFMASPGNCFGKMPQTACARLAESTQALIIYHIPYASSKLIKAMQQTTDPLFVQNTAAFQTNSLMIISDVHQADIFVLTDIEKNALFHKKILGKNDSAELSKLYDDTAEVSELLTVAYYLAVPQRLKNKKQQETNQEIELALFRDDFLHPAQELVSGIKALTFNFAIEDDKSIKDLTYVNVDQVKDWSSVKAVQIKAVTQTGKVWETNLRLRNAPNSLSCDKNGMYTQRISSCEYPVFSSLRAIAKQSRIISHSLDCFAIARNDKSSQFERRRV